MSILINEVQNAQSLNLENTLFNVEINHPKYGWIPYTLSPEDIDETINRRYLSEITATVSSSLRWTLSSATLFYGLIYHLISKMRGLHIELTY